MIINILVKELIVIGAKQTTLQMECLPILLTRITSMYKDFILLESLLYFEYSLTQWNLLDLFKLFLHLFFLFFTFLLLLNILNVA